MQESVVKPYRPVRNMQYLSNMITMKAFNYPMDAKRPAAAIAILPANDLFLLYGSFCFPNLRPTMSAIPGARKQ